MNDSNFLFQMPMYQSQEGSWSSDFLDTASSFSGLTWDPGALLSIVSFGYVCGDKTLFQEVRRQPWLSALGKDGQVELAMVPEHGFKKRSPKQIASELLSLLEDEAELACENIENIYVLVSGGMDSRIVAGVVKRLKKQGRVLGDIHAVTWGRSGSRDVEIGRAVAAKLGLNWQHLELTPQHLMANIDTVAEELGGLVSPIHLHRMNWFRRLSCNGIVLAGSYGDSVGRAEFSGRSVLELIPYKFRNPDSVLMPDVAAAGSEIIEAEMIRYRRRFDNRPEYAIRECEQQLHYMRGLIGHAMSVISSKCSLYQMFSAPEVYSYIWSIHPAFRTDEPYKELLDLLGGGINSLPWARTNRPLNGRPGVKIKSSVNQYHDYPKWMEQILEQVDIDAHIDWLAGTGIFCQKGVVKLVEKFRGTTSSEIRQRGSSFLSWTFALRGLAKALPPVTPFESVRNVGTKGKAATNEEVSRLRRFFRKFPFFLSLVRKFRKWIKKREALKEYPPID